MDFGPGIASRKVMWAFPLFPRLYLPPPWLLILNSEGVIPAEEPGREPLGLCSGQGLCVPVLSALPICFLIRPPPHTPSLYPFGFENAWDENKPSCAPKWGVRRSGQEKTQVEDCGGGRAHSGQRTCCCFRVVLRSRKSGRGGVANGEGLSKGAGPWWSSAEVPEQEEEGGLQDGTRSHLNSEMALSARVLSGHHRQPPSHGLFASLH